MSSKRQLPSAAVVNTNSDCALARRRSRIPSASSDRKVVLGDRIVAAFFHADADRFLQRFDLLPARRGDLAPAQADLEVEANQVGEVLSAMLQQALLLRPLAQIAAALGLREQQVGIGRKGRVRQRQTYAHRAELQDAQRDPEQIIDALRRHAVRALARPAALADRRGLVEQMIAASTHLLKSICDPISPGPKAFTTRRNSLRRVSRALVRSSGRVRLPKRCWPAVCGCLVNREKLPHRMAPCFSRPYGEGLHGDTIALQIRADRLCTSYRRCQRVRKTLRCKRIKTCGGVADRQPALTGRLTEQRWGGVYAPHAAATDQLLGPARK